MSDCEKKVTIYQQIYKSICKKNKVFCKFSDATFPIAIGIANPPIRRRMFITYPSDWVNLR